MSWEGPTKTKQEFTKRKSLDKLNGVTSCFIEGTDGTQKNQTENWIMSCFFILKSLVVNVHVPYLSVRTQHFIYTIYFLVYILLTINSQYFPIHLWWICLSNGSIFVHCEVRTKSPYDCLSKSSRTQSITNCKSAVVIGRCCPLPSLWNVSRISETARSITELTSQNRVWDCRRSFLNFSEILQTTPW
jgi:hypothetical protein